jgi:hypothetical protein
VRPAIVTFPVRCAVPVLAETRTLTLPLPLPLAPDVTVSHEAELDAVHAQPFAAVTATVLVSPGASTVRLVGVMEYVQDEPAAWEIPTGCPAIVSVTDRAAPVLAEIV